MSTLKLSILFFLCAVISACSQVMPFEDRRREPGTEYIWKGSSRPNRPVLCYNPLFHSKEKVLQEADKLCREQNKEAHAVLNDVEYFSCRLLIPSKAHYKCVVDK